jgi:hypothetical protein
MDIIAITLLIAVLVTLAARAVELAVRRPDAFPAMFEGARSFALDAVEESAAMRVAVERAEARDGDERPYEGFEQPALAA